MKIGLLTQWYDPEPGPAAIPGIVARALRDLGHEVQVLTGFPNYPSGRLVSGYSQRLGFSETLDGIAVHRAPLMTSHDASSVRRGLNYASFAVSAWARTDALRAVDALWVYNSPATVALPLARHSGRGAIPYFLQVQDLWPESVVESGMAPGGRVGRLTTAAIARIVRRMEREATVIGLSSPSMERVIASRHPHGHPLMIESLNPADESLFTPASPASARHPEWARYFTVLYAGAVGDVQGLDSVIDAARLLVPDTHVRIEVVGDGIARDRLTRRARDLPNVRFHDRVAQADVPALLASASAHLVALADRPFLRATTPSKIATLLAVGVPIVGHLNGDGADLIRRSGAGVVSTAGDAADLARAIRSLSSAGADQLRRMAGAGRDYYEEHLSARAAATRIVDSLASTGRLARHRGDKL